MTSLAIFRKISDMSLSNKTILSWLLTFSIIIYFAQNVYSITPNENLVRERIFSNSSKAACLYALKNEDITINFQEITKYSDHEAIHTRYQIFKNNYPIEGAQIILHEKSDQTISATGNLQFYNTRINLHVISASTALEIAKLHRNASLYAWETDQSKIIVNQLKESKPIPTLCWMNKEIDLQKELVLCYKIDLYSLQPYKRELIYVDALTGNIVTSIDKICEINVEGTAKTKYLGIQKITTDSVEINKFILRDHTRGNGIITLNSKSMNEPSLNVDFVDTDNHWDNKNNQKDEIATDAHFGAMKTYDYYKLFHNRKSIDDKDYNLISQVHFLLNYNNASWNGKTMNYGDGDNTNYNPFTLIDVCGHEVSHGFTEFTSNLIYYSEPGALNESISDIFGVAIKNWSLNNTSIDWSIGKGLYPNDNNKALRSLSNPLLYNNPKYYKGKSWVFGNQDNAGVHTNSGVFNYWFYILTEGGTGTNEIGYKFNIEGIGIEKAAKIVYRMNTSYLTPRSNYQDAFFYSIKAAEDLFGKCSKEIKSLQIAWAIVGVSLNTGTDNDVYVLSKTNLSSSCDLGKNESVTFKAVNGSCDLNIPIGTRAIYGVSINNKIVFKDSLFLKNDLKPNDTISFSSAALLDFSVPAKYNVISWVKFDRDTIASNDSIKQVIEKFDANQIDFALRSLSSNAFSVGCNDDGPLRGYIVWKNGGCEQVPQNAEIQISVINNFDQISTGKLTTSNSTVKGDSIYLPFSINLTGVLQVGNTNYRIYISNPGDINKLNDTVRLTLSKKAELPKDTRLEFFAPAKSRDTVNLNSNLNSTIAISGTRAIEGPNSIRMSGGNATNPNFAFITPVNEDEIWSLNPYSKSIMCICADASTMQHVKLKFDRKQNIANTLFNQIPSGSHELLSALRVLVNGTQVSKTYRIRYPNDTLKIFNEDLDLTKYAGTRFELCFEAFNLLETFSDARRIGDVVWLDNIILVDEVTVNTAEQKNNLSVQIESNPVYDELVIKSNSIDPLHFIISNIQGVSQSKGKMLSTNARHRIDISKLVNGVYFIELSNAKAKKTLKFIKK